MVNFFILKLELMLGWGLWVQVEVPTFLFKRHLLKSKSNPFRIHPDRRNQHEEVWLDLFGPYLPVAKRQVWLEDQSMYDIFTDPRMDTCYGKLCKLVDKHTDQNVDPMGKWPNSHPPTTPGTS